MKLSIVTPTFNSEKTVLDTCRSITSQSYKNFEHIVIDNCSSDKTIELIQRHYSENHLEDHLKIIIEKDQGISDAFNKGILHSSGEIVAILNSDDYYEKASLFKDVVDVFTKKEIGVFHGDMYLMDELFGSQVRPPLMCDLRQAMPLNHPTCFVKKSLYDQYGVFRLDYRLAMDFEWLTRFYSLDLLDKVFWYHRDYVVTNMRGDGASYKGEIRSIKECRKALVEKGLWNAQAQIHFLGRIFRTYLKQFLFKYNITLPTKIWRKIKWKK